MNAEVFYGGWREQTGGPTLKLVPGVRYWKLDAGGDDVALVLPDPTDIPRGSEHWRVFVENGALAFGQVTYQPPGIPIEYGGGLTVTIPPESPAGEFPLVHNSAGISGVIEGSERGIISPFVVDAGSEVPVLFSEGEFAESGAAAGGQWLGISFAGISKGVPRWLFQVGEYESAPAVDQSTGLVFTHGVDGASAPSLNGVRLDAGISSWFTLPNAGTARSTAAAFSLPTFSQDTHYICGSAGAVASCEKYLLDSWGAVNAMPAGRESAAAWDANALGFVHGGIVSAAFAASLLQLAPAGLGTWTTKASSIQARAAHTGGRLGGAPSPFAYLSGGGLAQDGSLVQSYQAGADVWGSNIPRRPGGAALGVTSGAHVSEWGTGARLFVGGRPQWLGTDLAEAVPQAMELRAVPVEAWHPRPNAPASLIDAAAAGCGPAGRVYVTGGGLSTASAATYSYGALDVWRTEVASPIARRGTQNHGTAGRSQR